VTDFADRAEGAATYFNLTSIVMILVGDENWAGTDKITITLGDVKFNTWNTTITTGETVLENVDWVGTLTSIA